MEHHRSSSLFPLVFALATLVPVAACDVADDPASPDRIGISCPALVAPGPSFCPNGDIVPRVGEHGCIVGYDCVVAHCPAIAPPPEGACGELMLVAEADEDGCTVGFECIESSIDALTLAVDPSELACPPAPFGCVSCPHLVQPGPNFCPGGTIVPVIDANHCIVGYTCT